ncbi:MAG: ABC transporter permease [Oscillospiraceae bacterium]|jgi:ribose/xylose/arabinose/galactoside ABC-type transport system permease subunit|nr:ABC transporter permease [Oscillospiraceae bacterium]
MTKISVPKFFGSKMFTLLLILAIIVIIFSVFSGGAFLQLKNIRSIVNNMVVVTFLTIGASLLLISGNIDLSTGAIGTLCGILLSQLLVSGAPWPVAALASIAAGAAFGALNAVLINELRFQAFIATMAVASIAEGLTYAVSGAKSIKIKDAAIVALGSKSLFGVIPITIFVALAAFLIYGTILNKTKFGRSVYLIGGNWHAARLSGLHPKKISYILFTNSGALGGLAGILLAARLRTGTVQGIINSQFSGMTAAILGGVSFGGGAGGLGGVFIGLLILNSFNNGTMVIGVTTYWQTVASGLLLFLALTFDWLRMRRA